MANISTLREEIDIKREDIGRLQAEYGLTGKQAAYVLALASGKTESRDQARQVAGYESSAIVTQGEKSKELQAAILAETRKNEEIARKVKEMQRGLDEDPRGTLERKLLEHSERGEITPNQTRALELVGKIRGLFVERIEVDPGEFFRSKLGQDLFPSHLLLEQKPQE